MLPTGGRESTPQPHDHQSDVHSIVPNDSANEQRSMICAFTVRICQDGIFWLGGGGWGGVGWGGGGVGGLN